MRKRHSGGDHFTVAHTEYNYARLSFFSQFGIEISLFTEYVECYPVQRSKKKESILANPTGFSGRIPDNWPCYQATGFFVISTGF